MQSHSKRITTAAALAATGLILSYLESFIVIPVRIPGIRIGFANIAGLAALYIAGPFAAVCVTAVRVMLAALLFGSPASLIYSASGAAVSVAGMIVLKRLGFSIYGVSVGGAALHNLGQIIAAYILVGSIYVFTYLPVLEVISVVTGLLTGFISDILITRLSGFTGGGIT